jgi:hypothetical protein
VLAVCPFLPIVRLSSITTLNDALSRLIPTHAEEFLSIARPAPSPSFMAE